MLLSELGFDPDNDCVQEVAGITVYPTDYFCPIEWQTGITRWKTSNTYSIHHYNASWFSEAEQPEDIIIFQEATRPMVRVEMISKLLQSCAVNGSANICQSMRDYVQFTVTDGVASYVDRDTVVDLQSTEAYRLSVIASVFQAAQERHHPLTESCCVMLMYNLGFPINFIEGSINNIKIVRQEDIAIFTSLLRQEGT